MNFQEIIAVVLVAGAVVYIAYRTYNSLHKKGCNKGCGCSGDISEQAKQK